MRILFVADGRSPIAVNWISHFSASRDHEIHLISTFPCRLPFPVESLTFVPVAFSGQASSARAEQLRRAPGIRLRTALRHWFGPLTIRAARQRARAVMDSVKPDLVHALRIPFEGMLAAAADPPAPLLISVWGNDFTLHAPASPGMRVLTRRALTRADGLHADCARDLRLAQAWGYPSTRPALVVPSSGGVRTELFHPRGDPGAPHDSALRFIFHSFPEGAPVVVNPRGLRAYVRNDVFFAAIPAIQEVLPDVQFLCPAMAGEEVVLGWLEQHKIRRGVHLLPKLTPEEIGAVFRRAEVSVSPSEHDGTPNSLLEAMACGCFPVAGDLESVREWVSHEVNGLLIDPADPRDLAAAVIRALQDKGLRASAVDHNVRLIAERARHTDVMARVEALYETLATLGRGER